MPNNSTTMSVSLPKDLKEYIQRIARKEYYGTPSDYIRSLIREDIHRQEQSHLENMLLGGLTSGPSRTMTAKEWQKLDKKILTKLKR